MKLNKICRNLVRFGSCFIVHSLGMGLFLFIDRPTLVCRWISFLIVWLHTLTNEVEVIPPGSRLALITKCLLCRRTHGIIQYVSGSCSGVPKGKLLQNHSKYGQLHITAKQQLAIAISFKLKITYSITTKHK